MAAAVDEELGIRRDQLDDQEQARRAQRLYHDHLLSRWLPVLGATRNPEAVNILPHGLHSEDQRVRINAVEGLACVCTDQVAEELAKRLPTETEPVQCAIMQAMRRNNDARHVQALLAVAGEPTMVETKLVWIETMQAVAPAKARPVLTKWTGSPNESLAKAVVAALAAEGGEGVE